MRNCPSVLLAALALAVPACSNPRPSSQTTTPANDSAPTGDPAAAPQPSSGDGSAEPTTGGDERRGLVRSEPLPELAAQMLRKQMGRHAMRMEGLQWSALMLNYEATQAAAESITSEPRIARPVASDDTLNAIIPPEFFDLQDELHAAAGDLAKAAEAKDDQKMASSYARVTQTCIRCHSLYLRIPGKAQ